VHSSEGGASSQGHRHTEDNRRRGRAGERGGGKLTNQKGLHKLHCFNNMITNALGGIFPLSDASNNVAPTDSKAELISSLVAKLVKTQITSLDPTVPVERQPEFLRLYTQCMQSLQT
jgi:hypothetical protein